MIKFALKCAQDHRFDSWFQSTDAFDKLAGAGLVTCAVCGSTSVEKTVMAPSVQASRSARKAQRPEPGKDQGAVRDQGQGIGQAQGQGALSTPASPAEAALGELRRKVTAQSEYVGREFAREARRMHDGGAPERPIWGEARIDEARKLVEDGVPVLPLPFRSPRKVN